MYLHLERSFMSMVKKTEFYENALQTVEEFKNAGSTLLDFLSFPGQ